MKSLIRKILKEQREEKSRIEQKRRYGLLNRLQYWDEEERSYVNPPSTDPEVMDWIDNDLRHRVRSFVEPIDVGFKLKTVGFEFPFIDKPVSARLYSEVDVQDVTTKEVLASRHGEEIVDGFINMMAEDYELTDEQSILELYKRFARFNKLMADHHKHDHFGRH